MKVRLRDIAVVIRSKNSGPYELTFDILFKDAETYEKVCRANCISAEVIAGLYGIALDQVINVVHFTPANAIKSTIIRPIASGDPGETDVYGAQQHAPLMGLEVDIESQAVAPGFPEAPEEACAPEMARGESHCKEKRI